MNRTVMPAATEQQDLKEKELCRDAGKDVVRVNIEEVESDDSWSSEEETEAMRRRRLNRGGGGGCGGGRRRGRRWR